MQNQRPLPGRHQPQQPAGDSRAAQQKIKQQDQRQNDAEHRTEGDAANHRDALALAEPAAYGNGCGSREFSRVHRLTEQTDFLVAENALGKLTNNAFEIGEHVRQIAGERRHGEIPGRHRGTQKPSEYREREQRSRQTALRHQPIQQGRADIGDHAGKDKRRQDPLDFIEQERDGDQNKKRRRRGNLADVFVIAAHRL